MLLPHLMLAILILILSPKATCIQEPPITVINLATSFQAHQLPDTYAYYQLTFTTNKEFLLLSLDIKYSTLISIYLSVHPQGSNELYYTHPNETAYTQECFQSSFETCVVRFDPSPSGKAKEKTVYFSVYAFGEVDYELWAVIDDIYNLNINSKYRLDFSKYESGLLQLNGDQMQKKEEVVMILTYNTTGSVGLFRAEAAVDEIPNSQGCCRRKYQAVTVGAYNKILKLSPIDANQTYYILIEGQKETKFILSFVDSTPSYPTIQMNSSVVYLTSHSISYSAYTTFDTVDLPLFIELNAYSGYGIFTVNYCLGYLSTTFQNINGQNGQIALTSAERKDCMQYLQSKDDFNGLLLESIQIDISNVYEFGYEIAIHQGQQDVVLRLNQQKYGVFLAEEKVRSYPIDIIVFKEEISVRYMQIEAEQAQLQLKFWLQQCSRRRNTVSCYQLQKSAGPGGDMTFVPQPNHNYILKVGLADGLSPSTNSSKVKFLVELQHEYQAVMNISPFRVYVQQVEQNQYNFYRINLTKVADEQKIKIINNTLLLIDVRQINGDIYTLSSLTIPEPSYEKYSSLNFTDQITFSWNGRIEMLVNDSIELIYLAIRGNAESLYQLQYTLDVDADIPAKYTKIGEGVQNNFLIDKTTPYHLFSFSSHILPFKVYITNYPKCIKMGYSLPLNQTCLTEVPQQFTNNVVYFNISNNSTRPFKFSVFVNTGDYILNDQNSILIGCVDSCYEVVTVQLAKPSNLIHQGRGQIYDVTNPNQIAYNSFLALTCTSYPCALKVNATLPYGGEMSLFLESSGIKEVEWRATPITFGDYPKKFIYPLRQWAEFNSILIYSQALQLQVYYNLVNIHQSQTNIQSYQFPSPYNHNHSHEGNPLRKIQVITIDDQLIEECGCKKANSYCLVALTLYPNLNLEYNEDYFEGGIGYISANTYQIYFPINMLYTMEEQFTLSYFVHRRGTEQIFSEKGYRIQIQALSNCHPTVFVDSDPNTSSRPSYNGAVVNYKYGWINFTVLAEKECRYQVALTNSLYRIIGQNRYYHLSLEDGSVAVLFRSQFSSSLNFKIEVTTGSSYNKVNYIVANLVNQSLAFVPPTPSKADFKSTNSSLTISEKHTYSLYLIVISANITTVQVIIRKEQPVILTRNQEEQVDLPKQSVLSYQISSTGSIAMFLTTSHQYVTVTIAKNYNRTEVTKTVVSPRSQPWVYLNASNTELVTYDITLLNSNQETTTVSIMFQQNDLLSLQRLYQGIVTYDAFTNPGEKNCYYFTTPLLVGRKDIVVDLVIGKNSTTSPLCSSAQGCIKLMYAATTKDTIVQSSMKLIQYQPAAYRLTLEFIPQQNYTICYHTPNLSALYLQYYLLLNDPSLPHLLQGLTHLQTNQNLYDMYQIVEEGFNELIMIELTSCVDVKDNNRILVGSSSFIDSELGRYTDLLEYQKAKSSIYAQLEVKEGYYYLGVKNELQQAKYANAYTLKYQNIGPSQKMIAQLWDLPDTKIVKIYAGDNQTILIHFELPEVVIEDDKFQQQNINITYEIVIMEYNNKTFDAQPLEIQLRCPGYLPVPDFGKQEAPYTLRQTQTLLYENQADYKVNRRKPMFNFSQTNLPVQFNVTGKVTLSSNGQQIAFYYENTLSNLNHLYSPAISAVLVVLIVVVVLLILATAAYVLCSYYKSKKQDQTQAMEMLNYNSSRNGAGDKGGEAKEKKSKKEGKYGELVDQIA